MRLKLVVVLIWALYTQHLRVTYAMLLGGCVGGSTITVVILDDFILTELI